LSALYSDLWRCRDVSTKTTCFLFSPPFVPQRGHFGHTSADTHTRLLPWLPEPIKRPGIKGSFGRDRRGRRRRRLLATRRPALLRPGRLEADLWADSRTPTALPRFRLTSCFLLHIARFFRDTADLRSDVPAHIMRKTSFNWQMFHLRYETHPQAGLQQADLSEAHSFQLS